ncbi:MAG: NYN domain-containing protein [Candidatus Omnitrophica bacterium]|nr:NYN domain-containing protein [Candidatus Omnitrophota bacterium]
MEYLIDGLNVIKSSFIKKYGKKTIEFSKEFLIDILEKYKRKHPSIEITVVFDGAPSSFDIYREKRIKIVFSQDITADEKIRKILENKKNKNKIYVVSDDREIGEFTKILGGNIFKVKEFLDIVFPTTKKEKSDNSKNLNYKTKIEIENELERHYEEKIRKNRREINKIP